MTTVSTSALVPYTPESMFSLVADVERYPDFLPWCSGACVHERSSSEVTASLEVSRGPLRKTFTTLNQMQAPRAIQLSLVEGPFKALRGGWHFSSMGKAGCKVQFELEFEFANQLVGRLLGPVFDEIAATMISSFCSRARELYGPQS
ncbi:MAG: type II toxin-antitoxin system RatA family toxin [Gammaproteobacteria bacterium]